MKNNHIKLMSLIQQAIQACGYDNSLAGVRQHLNHALSLTDGVVKKRARRAGVLREMEELAKKKDKEWWEMIKKNVANPLPELTEESPDPRSQGREGSR